MTRKVLLLTNKGRSRIVEWSCTPVQLDERCKPSENEESSLRVPAGGVAIPYVLLDGRHERRE